MYKALDRLVNNLGDLVQVSIEGAKIEPMGCGNRSMTINQHFRPNCQLIYSLNI